MVRFLIRNRRAAVDFNGGPAAGRLWAHLHTRSSEDNIDTARFILHMGRPWRKGDLNAGLLLAALGGKGAEIVRLLLAEGGEVNCRLADVRQTLLEEPGNATGELDWNAQVLVNLQPDRAVAGMRRRCECRRQRRPDGAALAD